MKTTKRKRMGARGSNGVIIHDPVLDELIGMQVRLIRKSQNLTQMKLAEGLDISYQQVQKYERGRNRIAASTLLCIAALLGRPVADFYVLADAFLAEANRQSPT